MATNNFNSFQPHSRWNDRKRTSEDFLNFCNIVLDYENYQDLDRRRHTSSPLGSTGSTEAASSTDSFPINNNNNNKPSSSSKKRRRKSSHSDADDHPDDNWDQITCYCKKPFAGRPMIECSRCLTWIHIKCSGLKRNAKIPENWFCSKCVQERRIYKRKPPKNAVKQIPLPTSSTSPS